MRILQTIISVILILAFIPACMIGEPLLAGMCVIAACAINMSASMSQ